MSSLTRDQANECFGYAWEECLKEVDKGNIKDFRHLRNRAYWRMTDYLKRHAETPTESEEIPVSDLSEKNGDYVMQKMYSS